ncbi:hypothetical protein P692DRAFT_201794874 [Suillus brevipes Sb2]|nr:hypothetical protein P692DRAFT_201794874 [Suillus brevipes Sb2]
MSGSSESRCISIRLEVISGKNLQVPSWRVPAGIYVPINVESKRRWKSAIGVLSSEESVVWGDTVTLSSHASPALSVEIRASYEADRMLGSGEVIGKLQMSWDELLNHGDEPFDLSFPPVRGVHPSLTLKAAVIQACNDQDGALSDSLVECEIARRTDAGHAQFAEYMASKTVSCLNAAVEHFQVVLDQCPASHPYHAAALTNLAWSRLRGYIRNHLQDIDTTISLFRDALALCPQRHPDHPLSLYNLTEALNWRHSKKTYQVCLELFDSHVMTRSSIIARREAATAFRHAQSLPVDAASCAIRRGNLQHAVELMEQGRGQQWSLVSRLRTPLDDLESTSPELARKVSELNKRLAGAQGSAGSTDRAAADRAATQYRGLTRQWEAAVAEIRNLTGFSRFLLPPAYEDLQAARHGPVIILIASKYSCSAIIVPTSGGPHHVPLSSIALADLNNLKERFTRAIRNASRMNPTEPRNDLIVLLRIVWNEIMQPIVNVLENVLKLKRRSRIWLCPTAAFTSIPLHAANPFLTKADRSKEPCLEDLYVCSYTPTLSALVRSRQLMKKRVTPSFVAIGQGQPGAGKGKVLLAVDSELELVHKLVPATAKRTTISGDAATRAGALKALEENTWVHLACHGKQDPKQPYHSHFVMRDKHLTLLNIMKRDIPHAEFAFLSACHTAVGDKKTPDEVIHLAAGFQFSGFKSVVGTLWEVDDSVAKHVVEAFYKYMFHSMEEGVMDCTKAAWALNCATHTVKTKVPLEQRMVFIHIGV